MPTEMYNRTTGYTARAFLLGGTAAEMKGMDAQLDHPTAARARNVRYTLLPTKQGRKNTAHKSEKKKLKKI